MGYYVGVCTNIPNMKVGVGDLSYNRARHPSPYYIGMNWHDPL
jgi:hypothetical protein